MDKSSSGDLTFDMSKIPLDDLKLAITNNKFGGICFKADKHDKAIEHFNKALQGIGNIVFTNAYQNLGNVYAQKNNIDESIRCYEIVIEWSPHNPKNKEKVTDENIYNQHINSKEAYIDAYTNLAVMYLKKEKIEKGLFYCQKATELDPENYTALVNLGDILRQVGRREEAIAFTWDLIEKYTREKTDLKDYKTPKALDGHEVKPESGDNGPVNILAVKWGKKYGADYVNKLYVGIKKYTTKPFKFYCFTDDPTGMHKEIVPIALKESWGGWWGKATLFSREYGIQGRKVFIDLDTVITGNIDEILGFDKAFGIMRTDLFECEKENKDGYNSSILMWNGDDFESIYLELKKNFDGITKFIVRFDYWLEMMVKNPYYIQDSFETQIVDYVSDCQEKLPQNSRIVCFPRYPKPHESNAPWIKEYWVDEGHEKDGGETKKSD